MLSSEQYQLKTLKRHYLDLCLVQPLLFKRKFTFYFLMGKVWNTPGSQMQCLRLKESPQGFKNHSLELWVCVIAHTHNLFTPPAPVPTPAHRPTPMQRAHPQSTVTKGKSWVQDIRLPLAARVCPAQCFLQIAAVWAKPPLCLLTIDGTWVGGVIISVRSDQGGVGGLVFGEVGVTV